MRKLSAEERKALLAAKLGRPAENKAALLAKQRGTWKRRDCGSADYASALRRVRLYCPISFEVAIGPCVDALQAVHSRGCGCYSSGTDGWHRDGCFMPLVVKALTALERI